MTVSRCSGGSDDGANRAEGLADAVSGIDLTKGQGLLPERIKNPISLENQVNLSVHVVVVFTPTVSKGEVLLLLLVGSYGNTDILGCDLLAILAVNDQHCHFFEAPFGPGHRRAAQALGEDVADQGFCAAAADVGGVAQMCRLPVVPQIADDFFAAFTVLLFLQGIDALQQFLVGPPVPVPQCGSKRAHALSRAVVVSQLLQVFLQVESVQYMARVGKTLPELCDPARPLSVDIDALHGIDVISLVDAGFHLVIESLCFHPISRDMQRID